MPQEVTDPRIIQAFLAAERAQKTPQPQPQAQPAPSRSIGDYLGMGARAVGGGIADLASTASKALNPLQSVASALAPKGQQAPSESDLLMASGRWLANKLGLAQAVTPGEKLATSAIRGATAAAIPGIGEESAGASAAARAA